MALVVKDDVKISEFINLSTAEKFLPAVMTSVKTVRISKVDKVIAMENDSLSDVDLLKGVKLVKDGYVCFSRVSCVRGVEPTRQLQRWSKRLFG